MSFLFYLYFLFQFLRRITVIIPYHKTTKKRQIKTFFIYNRNIYLIKIFIRRKKKAHVIYDVYKNLRAISK